jgi:putative transposase
MWTTKNQTNIIHPSFQAKLYTALERQFLEMGCTPKLITGNPNHVHCLYIQNPTKSIAEVIKIVKGNSSHFVNFTNLASEKFAWQKGYSAFSVTHYQLEPILKHLNNQDVYHGQNSYDKELESFLILHGLEQELIDTLEFKFKNKVQNPILAPSKS